MKKAYFLLFVFIITNAVYSNTSVDRCPSVMSKIAGAENPEEQVRIALEILKENLFLV